MRIALLADIHANRAALAAVLDEARRRGAGRLIVLGDVLGYHAEPDECVELLAAWPCEGVLGNHDAGALHTPDAFASPTARAVMAWTAARLGGAARAFLDAWPTRLELGWGLALHACFTHPSATVGYVTPTTAPANLLRLEALVASRLRGEDARGWLGLCGHTHVPALHTHSDSLHALAGGPISLPRDRAAIVNPGSVGQPRDGDARAAFALLDLDAWSVEFVRVAYDMESTFRALRAAGFDAGGAIEQRLREGR